MYIHDVRARIYNKFTFQMKTGALFLDKKKHIKTSAFYFILFFVNLTFFTIR